MFTPKHFAYSNIRNLICAQIAYTKEKIAIANYDKSEEHEYLQDRKEELECYKQILNILTDNKKKLTARER